MELFNTDLGELSLENLRCRAKLFLDLWMYCVVSMKASAVFLPRNAIGLLVCSAYPRVKGKTQLTRTSIRNDESLTETDALSSQRDTHKLAAGSHCSQCRWYSNNGRAAAV